MKRDEVAHWMNETAGQHWGDENHFQRFASAVAFRERQACNELWEQLRITDDQIRDVIEASVAVEREACAQIALQWDKEHPSTNFGGCIARSIRARGQA